MKLINQSFEIIEQEEYTISGVLKHIEKCARTCYKSEDKITAYSAEKFVERLIKSGHTAMLEHGTIYLCTKNPEVGLRYKNNKYSFSVNCGEVYYITTNYRVVNDNGWFDDLQFMSIPTLHLRRATVKFVTNRQVSHEFVRHRNFSFAQESTRFCNYSKGKFGKELTFIKPWFFTDCKWYVRAVFKAYFWFIEKVYMLLVLFGRSAQEAAQILPNATKTELVMTGSDWDHFFDLRVYGTTGIPHPQAYEVAFQAMYHLLDKNII